MPDSGEQKNQRLLPYSASSDRFNCLSTPSKNICRCHLSFENRAVHKDEKPGWTAAHECAPGVFFVSPHQESVLEAMNPSPCREIPDPG